jgi:hypothetical protein
VAYIKELVQFMKKKLLLIKGYSKTDSELVNDRKAIQLYIDFFNSNAGGAFDFDTEILILEEPDINSINNLTQLNEVEYLVVVLIGHGANKDGVQIFQLQENLFIHPGQIQFDCPRQLHIIESCRNIIDFELDIKRINRLIPKYKYGGYIKTPLTREESIEKFNKAIQNSDEGILYLFACSIDESAYGYFFLQILIDISIYVHEYFRNSIYSANDIFEHAKSQVTNLTKGQQNPMKLGKTDFPFVITIV